MSQRIIVLDTETTGIDHRQHRLIEIAGVEIISRQLTGKHFHSYLNPKREIDPGAQAVHGITLEFLKDKPLEEDIIDDFIAFITDSDLVIHNAPFDVGFLNDILIRQHKETLTYHCRRIIDTLTISRSLYPGKRNSLDALAERYQIDNSARSKKHGALIDAELLAQVYLIMTRGQENFDLHSPITNNNKEDISKNRQPILIRTSPEDQLKHQDYLKNMKKENNICIWMDLADKN
ncbi:DNA polymerase III subunit epsilon [Candidatus Ichthyocystis hellenicum]|uniref:DNA polymerase III subunit epsilon n=1 Tax=Candidatus Ichthyocystis hellenicum TaxID=1561003 RepID=UPI000B11D129|nr:DNA polymerase III subunit epsilon [Candidatus Ichthyocystis hellenicum]